MASTRRKALITLAAALPVAVALSSGVAYAAPEQQPGVTAPPSEGGAAPAPQDDQAGVTSSAPTPAPAPPPRPQDHSLIGDLIPDPAQHDPSDYRNPPDDQQSSVPVQPAPSLVQDLPKLHAPAPVPDPPKVIVPPPPTKLGLGDATIPKPAWVPDDVAWKVNGLIADAQQGISQGLRSVGVNAPRADVMAGGTVLGFASGLCLGAAGAGIPVAVLGALAGGTLGGVIGAGLGTLIPVPVVGTVTSGVAGTVIGAAAGAAIAGVPAAVIGGAAGAGIGALAGAVVTAGDGSDYTPPPPVHSAPPARPPGPSLHDQVRAVVDDGIEAGEHVVGWAHAQPGGDQVMGAAAAAGAAVTTAVQQQPWAEQAGAAVTQAARNTVAAAKAAPQTASIATAVSDVISEQHKFGPNQFGVFTDAANGALAALQGVVH